MQHTCLLPGQQYTYFLYPPFSFSVDFPQNPPRMKEIVGSVRVLKGIGTKQPPHTPLHGEWVPLCRFQPLISR